MGRAQLMNQSNYRGNMAMSEFRGNEQISISIYLFVVNVSEKISKSARSIFWEAKVCFNGFHSCFLNRPSPVEYLKCRRARLSQLKQGYCYLSIDGLRCSFAWYRTELPLKELIIRSLISVL